MAISPGKEKPRVGQQRDQPRNEQNERQSARISTTDSTAITATKQTGSSPKGFQTISHWQGNNGGRQGADERKKETAGDSCPATN